MRVVIDFMYLVKNISKLKNYTYKGWLKNEIWNKQIIRKNRTKKYK